VRESDLVLLTHAGPEIGVASTKAFTTQLVALLLLTINLARYHGMDAEQEAAASPCCAGLPAKLEKVLALDEQHRRAGRALRRKHHCLFLGRGEQYPIAMEGALKLKEISYIHAEAYPAGELKHGPLALIDEDMPVVAVAPNNALLEKLKSNLEEVRARGGQLFVFADDQVSMQEEPGITVIRLPETDDLIDPWSSPSRCSCSPTTSPPSRAPTSTSRATWPSPSPCECADLFQRSSSAVEGRNGQLSLHHHGRHRLSDRKLAALTAVHNFHIRRADGTTGNLPDTAGCTTRVVGVMINASSTTRLFGPDSARAVLQKS
jgi:hypothetical protein